MKSIERLSVDVAKAKGITTIEGAYNSYEGVLKRVDMALYEAKDNGKLNL